MLLLTIPTHTTHRTQYLIPLHPQHTPAVHTTPKLSTHHHNFSSILSIAFVMFTSVFSLAKCCFLMVTMYWESVYLLWVFLCDNELFIFEARGWLHHTRFSSFAKPESIYGKDGIRKELGLSTRRNQVRLAKEVKGRYGNNTHTRAPTRQATITREVTHMTEQLDH